MSSRQRGDRGQVLSSFAALGAVLAIVAGLVILFVTRDTDSAAAPKPATRTSTQKSPSPSASSAPPTVTPTSEPPPKPTTAPTSTPPPKVSPSESPVEPPSRRPTVQTSPSSIPVAELPAVEVYNNTRRRGLAEQVANKARAVGWKVAGADNWHGKIVASTVYYPAGMQAEAAQLARVLGIDRLKDALPNMKKDRLTVILTSDYSG